MKTVKQIIDDVLSKEKGYVNHKNDKGGPTKYGITLATARSNGYTGDMENLSIEIARAIYERRYVQRPGFEYIIAIDPELGAELVDTGVNMGPSRAAEFFQRWLNGFNKQGSAYADVFVDGLIGPVTRDAYVKLIEWRGEKARVVMLYAMNCLQGARYLEICENNETQEDFLWGWMLQRVVADLEARHD